MCIVNGKGETEIEYATYIQKLIYNVYDLKKLRKEDLDFTIDKRWWLWNDYLSLVESYKNGKPKPEFDLKKLKIYIYLATQVGTEFENQLTFKDEIDSHPKWYLHTCFPSLNIFSYMPTIRKDDFKKYVNYGQMLVLKDLIKKNRIKNKKKYYKLLYQINSITHKFYPSDILFNFVLPYLY